MSYSGDAAEQVVRLSLETGGVAVKLAGSGAKELAILLFAILREQKKTTYRFPTAARFDPWTKSILICSRP